MELKEESYVNLEVSNSQKTLVINASKSGLERFLDRYGKMEHPPEEILFEEWSRPQRRWTSWCLIKNDQLLPSDLTPYRGYLWEPAFNSQVDRLQICYVESEETLLCAGLRGGPSLVGMGIGEGIPILTLSHKGWKSFLSALHTLKEREYWFFITTPNGTEHKLKYQLTEPYLGEKGDHVFRAIEFIRLEPEEEAYVRAGFTGDMLEQDVESSDNPRYFNFDQTIIGNSRGILGFSELVRSFAESDERKLDWRNHWGEIPEKEPSNLLSDPSIVFFRKAALEKENPCFSFEGKNDGSDGLYIYGNRLGLLELADICEQYAFSLDHEHFPDSNSKKKYPGDTNVSAIEPQGTRAMCGWYMVGGARLHPCYNPLLKLSREDDAYSEELYNFLNKRVILANDTTL